MNASLYIKNEIQQEERSGCGGPDQQWPFYLASVVILLATLVAFIAIEIFSCPTLNLQNPPTSHSNEKTTYEMIGEIVLEIVSDVCSDKPKII